MILVTGATGTVGREVVTQLLAAGQAVRILTRDPSKAKFASTVEVANGDLGQPATLVPAFTGVEKVFVLSGGPELPKHDSHVAQAAKAAGAKHIVKLSVLGAGTGAERSIVGWHDAGETAIRESGLAWTFVRPGMFMSNARQWAPSIKAQGKVFLPYGDGRVPAIHPKDIAAVAVKALTSSGHEGKAYEVTGPEALTMTEEIKVLAEALGKPLEYVSISDEAAKEGMLKAGVPPMLADSLIKMGALIRNGGAATVLPTVPDVLQRPARRWGEWVKENVEVFR